MSQYSVIGKRLPRVDGVAKVTGQAIFTDDMFLPGMLCGKILRSPYAHARIINIDTSKALRLPGVRAVITGKDTAGIKFGAQDVPQYPADEEPIAINKVRYVGDEVAAVAAIDESIAEEALDLIKVEYEELPAVFDPEEAMKPEAPQLHEHVENNVCNKIKWDFGNAERGFNESDHIRQDKFVTSPMSHCAIEPHVAIASFDLSGKLTIWEPQQNPFGLRHWLAKTLNMPTSKVRVITPHIGGGFGGKGELMGFNFAAALLSKKTGKPVKITYTREEVFSVTRQRHPMIIHLKTGIKKDGTLMSTKVKIVADGGAYCSTGLIVMYLSGAFLSTVYRLPNVSYEGYRIYTNKPTRGALRGHGAPQPRFAFESQLDMLAEELGIDPMEVRLKNALQPGDSTPNRFKVTTCGLVESIHKAAQISRWKEKRGKLPKNQGIGMALGSFISGILAPPFTSTGAFIKLHEDGGVTLITGVSDIGQGSDTILGQIAADELGIALRDVTVISGDTDIAPAHAGSYSSRGTLWGGKAVKIAAADAKQQLFEVVAQLLEANVQDLEARDRRIYVKGSPERGMSFVDAVMASVMSKDGNPILGRGFWKSEKTDLMNAETGEGNVTHNYSFEAQIAEVEVDPDTGQVKLINMTVAHDSGLVINPMAVEGQLEGSVSMGLGQALLEQNIIEKGRVLNPSFLDYKLHTSLEMPNVKSILIETANPEDCFEPKEAGEGTQVPTPAAIANAIYDAVGIRIKELPATPEKILKAIGEKKKGISN